MRFIGNERDIIIVTGCNAVGKTTASNHLRYLAKTLNIPFEEKIVADSHCLFEAMQWDDKGGGFHHTHQWCEPEVRGHTHNSHQAEFPFTVTDNMLPNIMRVCFFEKLAKLERNGRLWLVEWAAGVNTNPLDDPTLCIDYSYAKVKSLLQEKNISNNWLKRVKAVIHVTADSDLRFVLNQRRSIPSSAQPEAIEAGTAFWQKDERVLRFYGRDDFSEIEDHLDAAGICIHPLDNDGGTSFFNSLESIAEELFVSDKTAVKSFSLSIFGMITAVAGKLKVYSLPGSPKSVELVENLPISFKPPLEENPELTLPSPQSN
jgi:hypothetical protein